MSIQPNATDKLNRMQSLFKSSLERQQIEVPMLPKTANRAVQLTQDPDSDATKLATLIQGDQSLAAHVMRVANSAAYSPNSSIVSLQQAIARLGMQMITNIVLSVSINSKLFKTPGFEDHINYELRHSLVCALWAKEVARACRKNVEAAFISGLLHDIGKPITVQNALNIADNVGIAVAHEDVFKLEELYQRQLGKQVVAQWQMPSTVQNVIQYFDQYGEKHEGQILTMAVVAGTKIADHMMCEQGEEHCMTREELLAQPIFADLNLYQDEIENILERESDVKSTLEIMSA